MRSQEVISIRAEEDGCRAIELANGMHLDAYTVLVASGASYRRLGVPGEEDYIGAGVHYCATCDGPFYQGAPNVTVIGGGNSAAEESLHLLKFAKHVHMLVRGPALTASKTAADSVATNSGITVHYNTQVLEIEGERGKLAHVVYADSAGQAQKLATSAAFVFIGQQPNTGFLKDVVRMDGHGFILTGHDLVHGVESPPRVPFSMESSVPGIFAAGDCRAGSTKQVASAVGEGASAAIAIRDYLKTI